MEEKNWFKEFQNNITATLKKWEDEDKARNDAHALSHPEQVNCDHGVVFDSEACTDDMSSQEVRRRWPRGGGPCPKGCGFNGIAYASFKHFVMGDW